MYKIKYHRIWINHRVCFIFQWLSKQTQCTDHAEMILIIIWTRMDLLDVSQSFKQIAFWQWIRSLWQVQKNRETYLGRSWIQNSLRFLTKKHTHVDYVAGWGGTVKAVFDIQAEVNWNQKVIFFSLLRT